MVNAFESLEFSMDLFFEQLCAALLPHVPHGISLFYRSREICLGSEDGGHDVWLSVYEIATQPGDLTQNIVTATYSVMSNLQDIVSETVREPWPTASGVPFVQKQQDGTFLAGFCGPDKSPIFSVVLPFSE